MLVVDSLFFPILIGNPQTERQKRVDVAENLSAWSSGGFFYVILLELPKFSASLSEIKAIFLGVPLKQDQSI